MVTNRTVLSVHQGKWQTPQLQGDRLKLNIFLLTREVPVTNKTNFTDLQLNT